MRNLLHSVRQRAHETLEDRISAESRSWGFGLRRRTPLDSHSDTQEAAPSVEGNYASRLCYGKHSTRKRKLTSVRKAFCAVLFKFAIQGGFADA